MTGEQIAIQGRVLDGDGKPVNDALVEIWQANAHGKYAHPEDKQGKPLEAGFKGFGRSATDENGAFRFKTIKPGRVPGPGGALQAPHIAVTVFMRGLLKHLVSRIYFPDEPANADDPVAQARAGGAPVDAGREEASRRQGRAGVERHPPGGGRDRLLRRLDREAQP